MSLINVSFAECKCLVRRWNAQRVLVTEGHLLGACEEPIYFCASHKKPYDIIENIRYFKNKVHVHEDGTPVGYVKRK